LRYDTSNIAERLNEWITKQKSENEWKIIGRFSLNFPLNFLLFNEKILRILALFLSLEVCCKKLWENYGKFYDVKKLLIWSKFRYKFFLGNSMVFKGISWKIQWKIWLGKQVENPAPISPKDSKNFFSQSQRENELLKYSSARHSSRWRGKCVLPGNHANHSKKAVWILLLAL
jgi:hypothetical protein